MKRLLLLVSLSLLAMTGGYAQPAPETAPLALGASAPDFKLPGVDGKLYTLEDFAKARVLVVVFTCNHCPYAQAFTGRIMDIASGYKEKGVRVVGISSNAPKALKYEENAYSDLGDSFSDMKIAARDRKYNFPYLYDGDELAAAKAYGALATPHVFVFDKERKLRYVGAVDDAVLPENVKKHYLADAIDALLAGKKPPVEQTKPVGCSIKKPATPEALQAYMDKYAEEPVTLEPADENVLKNIRKGNPEKIRLVNLYATWCPPCQAEFDDLVAINRMYRKRDFETISVSINAPEEKASVLAFLKKRQASMANYIFASADADKLGTAFSEEFQGAVPFTMLIDTNGKTLYLKSGGFDTLELRRAIVKALNEKKPFGK